MKGELITFNLHTVLYIQAMKSILIHCKPDLLDYLVENDMNWGYSPKFGVNEIDVIVDDVDNYDDEQLCSHYGINYDQVNCIEAVWITSQLVLS